VAPSPETPRITNSPVVSFGRFEVDFQSGVLSGNGTKTFLQGQSLHLLELLVQHPGRVVTREQIRQRLWPDGTIVEFEHSVNAAVKRLREALGDDAEKPCYIETIPRRGYRLIAPVGPASQSEKPGMLGHVSALRSVLSRGSWRWAGIAAVLLMLAVGLLLSYRWSRPTRPVRSSDLNATVVLQRLTDFVGIEESPAVSPDGKSVAFSAGAGTPHIWVRLLSGGSSLKITQDNVAHLYPRWSPDSVSLIYFTPGKGTAMEGGIYEIPALGGSSRRLASSFTGGDISHDGKRLAYFRRDGNKLELVIADRDGSKPQVLALLEQEYDYGLPRWSPDDRHIAYRRGRVFDYEIFTIPSTGGESRQITHDLKLLAGYSWVPDGSGIVCSSSRNTTSLYLPTLDLFSARLEGGSLHQLTFGDTSFLDPDVDGKGRVFVSQQRRDSNIWRFPIDGSPAENVRRAAQVTSQTAEVQTPSLSPDGREMVYLSEFGGHSNLWVKKLDGSTELRQITFEQNPDVAVGVPVWSPDGRYITFFTRRRDTKFGDQWVVNPDGTNLRQLVPEGGWAAWSNDGKWLYVSPQRGEGRPHTITKIPVDGGEAIEVRTDESFIGTASVPDGNTLYFVRMRSRAPGNQDVEIHRASPEDGPSKIIARIPARRWPMYYLVQPVASPDSKWLAVMLADGPATNLYLLPTAGGSMRQVTDFGKTPTEIPRRVSWSPDSKHIYAAVTRVDADVVVLTNLLQRD
jgi:Tol biopolymer transport system component/DNA-binding winged helix-turn-helix (wHTH) protein